MAIMHLRTKGREESSGLVSSFLFAARLASTLVNICAYQSKSSSNVMRFLQQYMERVTPKVGPVAMKGLPQVQARHAQKAHLHAK